MTRALRRAGWGAPLVLVSVVGLVAVLATVVSGPTPGAAAGKQKTAGAAVRAVRADSAPGAQPVGDAPMAAMAADATTGGYWLVGTDGGVFAFDSPFLGSAVGLGLHAPVVGMDSTPDAGGYWEVASDGGVFAFGDARFAGSMGGAHLNAPVVAMDSTPDGGGYWEVASDGGVFAFGDARFAGSMGGAHLNAPVVAMASTPAGGGYWEVASDGGVFAFGDARFAGSMGATALARPMVAMVADAVTGGYWLIASDGGVFAFDAPFLGSTGALVLNRAVAGAAATVNGGGYWLVGADGGVYAFGDAAFRGSVAVLPLAGLTVVLDPGHDGANSANPQIVDRPIDGGGFTEPCDTSGTSTDNGYPEHAFTFAVALGAQSLLEAAGAVVVLTRTTDNGVGPCVNARAELADQLHAAAAVSIHGDGGPPGGRGFAVDTPRPVVSSISDNRAIVGPSAQLGEDERDAFEAATGEPPSDYTGVDGIVPRSDLGGLNLSTVPKVLIECANMRNATDAALVQSAAWRQLASVGVAEGLEQYLEAAERT